MHSPVSPATGSNLDDNHTALLQCHVDTAITEVAESGAHDGHLLKTVTTKLGLSHMQSVSK